MSAAPELRWWMTVEGDSLLVHHRVTNTTGGGIYVVDSLLVRVGPLGNFARAAKQVVVVEEHAKPGHLRFFLGVTPGNPASVRTELPTFRPLAAGETLERTHSVALPIKPWHNSGRTVPFKAQPKTGTFFLQWMGREPPKWRPLEAANEGETLQVPAGDYDLQLLDGGAQDLPA